MSLGLILLGVYSLFFFIVAIALDVRLDWTEDKELLLWYSWTDEFTGRKERNFIKLLKL